MRKRKIVPDKKQYNFKNKDNSWIKELNLFFKDIKQNKSSLIHLNNLYKNFKIIDRIYSR